MQFTALMTELAASPQRIKMDVENWPRDDVIDYGFKLNYMTCLRQGYGAVHSPVAQGDLAPKG